jgi:regulator of sirC expression with transglutaminase-like and TPR domain
MTAALDARAVLRRLASDAERPLDLAEGALALAALARPGVELAPYRAHLAALARAVERAVAGARGLAGHIAALNGVLFDEQRYAGDEATYDDLDNADLIRVIDRRKGLPVALGILYIHAARAQGWAIAGLAFPGHFLLRLEDSGARAIVDPFHGGRSCSPADLRHLLKLTAGADAELAPDLYASVSDRQVLLRLENNVVSRQIRAGRLDEAVRTLDAMLLFAPDEWRLLFERGTCQARLGNLGAAIASLDAFLERAPAGGARAEAAALLQTLRRRLN